MISKYSAKSHGTKLDYLSYRCRVIGTLLVVLIGLQAFGQTYSFETSTSMRWAEEDGLLNSGDSLDRLNHAIGVVLPAGGPADLCYTIDGVSALAFASTSSANCRSDGDLTRSNDGRLESITLALKSGQHVDYDRLTGGAPTQVLTITGHLNGDPVGTATVTLNISNYDEQHESSQGASNPAPVYYWREDESQTLFLSNWFSDPEGMPFYFDSRELSTDIWICDTAVGGDHVIEETPNNTPRPAASAVPGDPGTQGSNVEFTGGNAAENCSVSNTAGEGSTPSPGIRGSAGNRVVTVSTIGPLLRITANSVYADSNNDGTISKRPAGTYTAKVFFRAWTSDATSSEILASSNWSSATIHVKIGANNPPQFAGGATGFSAELEEGSSSTTGKFEAWIADDLDSPDANTNDQLVYSLEGARRGSDGKKISLAGGTLTLNVTKPGNALGEPASLELIGQNLDYDLGLSFFEIGLLVDDHWVKEPVRVPIYLTLLPINELVTTRRIKDLNLVNGESEVIDLTSYYKDPEGDEITFEAYSNIHNDIVTVDNEAKTMRIFGKHATPDSDSEVTITVLATDSQGLSSDPNDFIVTGALCKRDAKDFNTRASYDSVWCERRGSG